MQSASQARILVVDDDPMLRDVIRTCLSARGFDVSEADNGEEGLGRMKQQCPDLLLCDVQMPLLNGLDVLKKVKQLYPHLPVIMISGAGFIQDVVGALRLGAWDYLIKPLPSLAVLEHAVTQALRRAELERENRQYRLMLEKTNHELASSLAILQEDQEAGRQVQARLLPEPVSRYAQYCFSHALFPSLYLSGDFLDCFCIDDRYLIFYIADVSGHGSSSAFVTVLLKSLVSQVFRRYQEHGDGMVLSPAALAGNLNVELLNTGLGKYLTMFYAVLDMQEEVLRYCVAGHYPRPVFAGDGQAGFLAGHGFPVGLFPDATYGCEEQAVPSRFSLVMVSDGLLDALAGAGLQDKEQELCRLCSRPDLTFDAVLRGLRLGTDVQPADDITVCMLQREG